MTLYKCDRCENYFMSQQELEWYIETTHEVLGSTEVMQFICNKFNFQSMDETALNTHIQKNHLDLKVNIGKAEQITVAPKKIIISPRKKQPNSTQLNSIQPKSSQVYPSQPESTQFNQIHI